MTCASHLRLALLGALSVLGMSGAVACSKPQLPEDSAARKPLPLSASADTTVGRAESHASPASAAQLLAGRTVPALTAECDGADPASCVELGRRLLETSEGETAATQRFRQACDHGSADGCGELGYATLLGRGLKQDEAQGKALLERGCNGSSARACSRLSALYLQAGPGEREVAVGLSRKGCDAGDALGCYNLALMLDRGDGVPQDSKQAVELYRTACKGDMGAACRQLGMAYAEGRGLHPNPRQAAAYNIRACDLRDAAGCGNAGINYQRGLGIKPNPIRAAHYFKQACDLGDSRYCELLQRFRTAVDQQPSAMTVPVTKPGSGAGQ